ncbi:EfeM/EfeO family lipoprotein [Actinopolymorpha pittospori]
MSVEPDADPDAHAGPAGTPDHPGAPATKPAAQRGRRSLQAAAGLGVALVLAGAITTAALVTGTDERSSVAERPGSGSAGTATVHKSAPPALYPGMPHTSVSVAPGSCGKGWTKPRAGVQVFDLHNTAASGSEVYLIDPRTGKVFGEVEGLAPGTSRPMLVDLGSGSYRFRCLQEDTDAITGPTVVVPGDRPQGPASLPVTQHDVIPPTLGYQEWIGTRMSDLVEATAKLRADIDDGDLAAARRDWLSAHLVYERMGAAYGTFGDADGAINGTAARTPDAVRDPGFTGFHRIEYGLWHGESAASLRTHAAKLDTDVRALRTTWTQARMDPADLGLRAHEIIENTEQFELTGRTDYGSGTNLATARANIDGTREILRRLDTLLAPRDPDLARLNAALDRAQAALDAQNHHGTWTPLGKLTHNQRQRINADFGDLLEQLAPVAAIFDIRRTA